MNDNFQNYFSKLCVGKKGGKKYEKFDPFEVRKRTKFSILQNTQLESLFQRTRFPAKSDIQKLSHETGLDCKTIQVWFQNKRAKYKNLTLQNDGYQNFDGNLRTAKHLSFDIYEKTRSQEVYNNLQNMKNSYNFVNNHKERKPYKNQKDSYKNSILHSDNSYGKYYNPM